MPAQIAKQHGVLLDPIYTLAAWEVSHQLAHGVEEVDVPGLATTVVMLHTGGSAGLYGLAQRYPDSF